MVQWHQILDRLLDFPGHCVQAPSGYERCHKRSEEAHGGRQLIHGDETLSSIDLSI